MRKKDPHLYVRRTIKLPREFDLRLRSIAREHGQRYADVVRAGLLLYLNKIDGAHFNRRTMDRL
jgi:hypothetical protein